MQTNKSRWNNKEFENEEIINQLLRLLNAVTKVEIGCSKMTKGTKFVVFKLLTLSSLTYEKYGTPSIFVILFPD